MATSRIEPNDEEKEENLSFWESLKRWVKRHPIASVVIAGLVITAAVFTGGAILAPIALSVMASIGTWVTAVVFGALSLAICTAIGLVSDKGNTGVGGGSGAVLGILAALGGGYGGVALCAAVPLVGVVACGLLALAVSAVIFGALGWVAKKCFGTHDTPTTTTTPTAPSPDAPASSPSLNPHKLILSQSSPAATHSAVNPDAKLSAEDQAMIKRLDAIAAEREESVRKSQGGTCWYFFCGASSGGYYSIQAPKTFKAYLRNPSEKNLVKVEELCGYKDSLLDEYDQINPQAAQELRELLATRADERQRKIDESNRSYQAIASLTGHYREYD